MFVSAVSGFQECRCSDVSEPKADFPPDSVAERA
jgi:hypothetical protein